MFCKYCGAANADDGKFCQSCGKSLVEEAPAYSEPAYAQPAYSEPVYSEPVYAEPAPVTVQPAPRSNSIVSKVMGLISLTLFLVSFITILSGGNVDPSPAMILELIAFLMLGIGLLINGTAGRVMAGIAPIILAIVALSTMVNSVDNDNAALQIIGYLIETTFILSGIGILVGKKGMIIGGTIPALIGCFFTGILYFLVEAPFVFELTELAVMLITSFLAYAFACIAMFTCRTR